MIEHSTSESVGAPSRPWLPVILVAVCGAAFSLAVFFTLGAWERKNTEKAFRLAAEDRAKAVRGAFETESAMLDLVRSALMTDGRIERQEFGEITTPFLARSQSIMAVEWAPRVADDQRAEFEAAARRDGLPDFQITQLDGDGHLAAAPQRNEYFPIYYIGPRQDDKHIYGYDVASEPIRREALMLAGDTGKTTASGRIAFINDKRGAEGFFTCLPVYKRDQPAGNVAQRRQNLLGFVLGVFKPNDMIAAAVGRLQPEGIDVGLYDPAEPSGEKSLFYRSSRARDNLDDPFNPAHLLDQTGVRYVVPLNMAGHDWTVVCAPTPEFTAAHASRWPAAALTAGLLFTALAAGQLWLNVGRAERLERKVHRQTAEIRSAQEDALCRLASAAQRRDDETSGHVRRIGPLSQALARAADWFGDDLEAIRQAAAMHDIGKIGVPDAILRKAEKLSPSEAEVLKTHTRIGAEIFAGSNVPMLKMARDIALNHHERWDGRGYPRGLAGNAIPESARIVAIVDAYDALTHATANRPALPEEEALEIMRRESAKQFDPTLLSLFFQQLAEIRSIAQRWPDGNRSPGGAATTCGAPLTTAPPLEQTIPQVAGQ